MKFNKQGFSGDDVDEGDPMLPFMSLLLIIIPVLIGNIAFYHFKSIEVNIPGTSAENEEKKDDSSAKNEDDNVILQLTVEEKEVILNLVNEDSGETVLKEVVQNKEEQYEKINAFILAQKNKYPKLNAILASVGLSIEYEQLVKIFDQCKIGEDKVNNLTIVLMPKGEENSEEEAGAEEADVSEG